MGTKKFVSILICMLFGFYHIAIGQIQIPLDSSIKQSNFIFEGRVISSTPFVSKDSNIYTSNIVKISKVFKGKMQCGNVEIITYQDATIGGRTQGVMDIADALFKGSIGVFMCNRTIRPFQISPKENPAPLQLYAGNQSAIIYQINGKDTVFMGWSKTYNSSAVVYDFISSKTGHKFTSCMILNEPINQGSLQNKLNNPVLNVEVYPNPVNSAITIKIPNSETGLFIIIYDDSRKTVFKKENISATELQNIDMSSLKSGNYIGVATSSANTYHFKFSKL